MTWAERIAHIAGSQERTAFFTEDLPRLLTKKLEAHARGSWGAGDQLGRWIAQVLFTRGPDFAREAFGPVRHVAPRAVAAYLARCDPEAPWLSTMMLELSNTTNGFEILGYDVPPSVLESFVPYLPRLLEEADLPQRRWEKGFTALALGERRVWAPIAGLWPDAPVPFTPGATFGPNVQGLLAHLGGARLAGASFRDVEPAWSSFMTVANPLINVAQITYELILWVARIVHHHIGHQPLGRVADLLYADIERCVAAGV